MDEDYFDDYAKKLEELIREKTIEDYNEYIVNLCYDPKNWGKPPDEEISVSKIYKGPCGDTMEFFLKIKDNIIEKAHFVTDGCGASVATASQTTILIEGKSIAFAESLTPEDIDSALKGLPEDHKHCAELCSRTLRKAIKKYRKKVA
ncbi:MAG: iron-sulfur cluster assembly scaffold protein [Promethearchaeota archaeon]